MTRPLEDGGHRTGKATAVCLLVANTFPPVTGGSSAVYCNLARLAAGEIVVLTGRRDYRTGLPFANVPDFAFPVVRIAFVRPLLPTAFLGRTWLRRLTNWRGALHLLYTVAKLIRRYRVGVVCIADDETVGWLIPFVRFIMGRSVIVYSHGDELTDTAARSRLRRTWLSLADAIVAASNFAKSRLIEEFGVREDKVVLIANGVDLNCFRPQTPLSALIARYGLEGRRVIMSVSRLVPRKGIDRVLEALPMVIRRHPDVLYLIIGGGPDRDRLKTLAQRLGVANSVYFTGSIPQEEMPAHYALSDLMVLPNRIVDGEVDGMPLVFFEANACGKPVIGGRAGGTAEAVRDGYNGFLVDGENEVEVFERIDQLLSDAKLYQEMQRAGLEVAASQDWGRKAREFIDLCSRLDNQTRV